MNLTKNEKKVYISAPWFFGMVMIVCGTYISFSKPEMPQAITLISSGLICFSIYCVCALLVKLIEK